MRKLTSAQREFFSLVSDAVSSNPFGADRPAIDRRIVQAPDQTEWHTIIPEVVGELRRRLARLERERPLTVLDFSPVDADLLRISILFHFFHEQRMAFDELIDLQIKAGEEPCDVPFANEAIERLAAYGFTHAEACRLFAVCFQLRRAFYFIWRGLTGTSACIRELRKHLWDNVFTHDIRLYEQHLWNRMEDFSVLILGETGVGKGATAAALGRSAYIPYQPRKHQFAESFVKAFVSINLSQYPATLIESELFGHQKGAFTGAVTAHEGIFGRCSRHGAIFLDEIGDVGLPLQIKLLQVLQERTFCPVGSHRRQRFAGRVIAATNQPLDQLRRAGKFREDFYYRLCSDIVTVPPLRTRIREDAAELDTLVGHILERLLGREAPALHKQVIATLLDSPGRNYAWPGNVRELEQAVRRILTKGNYDPRPDPLSGAADDALVRGIESGELSADALVAAYCKRLYQQLGTYGKVAERTGLDWRTVKKNIRKATAGSGSQLR